MTGWREFDFDDWNEDVGIQGSLDGPEWTNEVLEFGSCCVGKITQGKRLIGWHVQDSRGEVFFVTGPDITVQEIESYSKSLEKNGFSFAVVIGQSRFREFVESKKHELDPMFLMAATFV